MADQVKTTMNTPKMSTPSMKSGSGEFGGDGAAEFGKNRQTQGAGVIPIKTRESLNGTPGPVKSTMENVLVKNMKPKQ